MGLGGRGRETHVRTQNPPRQAPLRTIHYGSGAQHTFHVAHVPWGLSLGSGGLQGAGNRPLGVRVLGPLQGPASPHPVSGVRWAGALTFSRSGLTQCSVSWMYWFNSGWQDICTQGHDGG